MAWDILSPLAQSVTKGEIDGFEIPFEAVSATNPTWPDETPVVKYNAQNGILLFRPGAYKNYGFDNEAEFASAVKTNSVKAKTPEGAISLGLTRGGLQKPVHLFVRPEEAWFHLRFLAGNEEEAEKMESKLKTYLPNARFRRSRNALQAAIEEAFPFNPFEVFGKFGALLPRQKLALSVLTCVGLVTVTLETARLFGWMTGWYDLLFAGIFVVTLVLMYPMLLPDSRLNKK